MQCADITFAVLRHCLKADCSPFVLGLVRRMYYGGDGLITYKKLRRVQTVRSCPLLITQERSLSQDTRTVMWNTAKRETVDGVIRGQGYEVECSVWMCIWGEVLNGIKMMNRWVGGKNMNS